MVKYLTFSILSLFVVFQLSAQRPQGRLDGNGQRKGNLKIELTGKLVDVNSKKPLAYATVSVFSKKQDNLIDGGLTDDEGKFSLTIKPFPSYVVIEYISYEKVIIDPVTIDREKIKAGNRKINLGEIGMSQNATTLDEVEIRAEKSEAQFRLDKTIFNVGKDLANKGGTAEEVLDNVPSVSVDIDGNVSLRGNEGVRILIDGKPSGLAGAGNTNGLRNIPSNLIEQVEVITNPSARYEAEGMAGIINIILKKDKGHGFNGAFDLTGGYPTRLGAAANINYRKGKLNWFANYGLNYRENPGGGFNYSRREVGNQIEILDQQRTINRTGLSNNYRAGLDYFITDKSQITGSFLYSRSDEDNTGLNVYLDSLITDNSLPQFVERTERTDLEKEDEQNLEYSVNYRREFSNRNHSLNISGQFRDKGEVESSRLTDEFVNRPTEIDTTNNDEGNKTWLFQADYVHPITKDKKWETGLRLSLRDISNDFEVLEVVNNALISIPELNNEFLYDENIMASYFIFGNKIDKISYQAGLRAEYTDIETQLVNLDVQDPNAVRDYLDWFPSGHLGYSFNPANSMQVSYSRRVRRPRFWDLNPFFSFSDNRNFFGGNPTVNPEYTDSYEVGYIRFWEKATLSSSLFYRATTSRIQRILTVDQSNGNTITVPLNIGDTDDFGFDITVSYSGLSWFRLDGNVNLFQNRLTVNNDEADDVVYNYFKTVRQFQGDQDSFDESYSVELSETNNFTWNGRLTARFSFWDSDLQIRTNYRGARETAQGSRDAVGSLDIGWSKDFLSAKNLTLTLSVRDLLNSRKRIYTTEIENFFRQGEFQWRSRSATMTASYRINQKKKRGRRGQENGGFEGGEF